MGTGSHRRGGPYFSDHTIDADGVAAHVNQDTVRPISWRGGIGWRWRGRNMITVYVPLRAIDKGTRTRQNAPSDTVQGSSCAQVVIPGVMPRKHALSPHRSNLSAVNPSSGGVCWREQTRSSARLRLRTGDAKKNASQEKFVSPNAHGDPARALDFFMPGHTSQSR